LPEVHGDAETEIYLGKPNEQKTHEQMALELTALTEQAPTADLTEQIPINTSNPARPRATPPGLACAFADRQRFLKLDQRHHLFSRLH
jgi:hypothetical protein